jgi:hypothetical protein
LEITSLFSREPILLTAKNIKKWQDNRD